MGKNIHFTGQPLYSQILNLVDKTEIKRIIQKGNYDRYTKKLDGYTHMVILLFAVLMRYDSLREIIIGMLSEANKLNHLGIKYMVKRSTLAEANNRRSSEFFSEIYNSLYLRYKGFLSDSNSKNTKEWENQLYIMDSTTISLFTNILKGAGRNPNYGKKKGGIKAHTIIKAKEEVPCLVCYTSAATHDHFLLKKLQLPSGSFIALDRAYIDYKEFQRLTEEGVYYVSKMKKNLNYTTTESIHIMNPEGCLHFIESKIIFKKSEIQHKSRKIEYWRKDRLRSTILITNNFELHPEDIIAIYDKRWQIESLFKQLKQNFPLKYFYGDSVNAIQSQIWVTLIANLLLTIIKRKVKKRSWCFSNMITMIRQMLMYYIDLFSYLENPEKAWIEANKKREPPPVEMTLF